MDRILSTDELINELKKYNHKALHIHHTWKPAHKSFNGKNHLALQQGMRNYHIGNLGWSDIGQHVTLMPDGTWVTGRAFKNTPASITNYNLNAFAVEMLGNFDKKGVGEHNVLGYDVLEGKQKDAILELSNYFGERLGYNSIIFHREKSSKTCPGTSIDKDVFLSEAKFFTKDKPTFNINVRGDVTKVDGYVVNGTTIIVIDGIHIPVRRTLEALGFIVGWDSKNNVITVD